MKSFLADSPNREAVILRFGTPSEHFENQRIVTYLLRFDDQGNWHPVPRQHGSGDKWVNVTHNLVAVFRPDGTLEKHNIIRVRDTP